MNLNVLGRSAEPTSFLREYARLEIDWCRAVADATEITGATVFSSRQFPDSTEANTVANAWLPAGTTWADLWSQVGSPPHRWWFNPSMPPEQTDPIAAGLAATGWRHVSVPLLRWADQPIAPTAVAGFTIIPARSAYPSFEKLRGPLAVAHLDDPQVEAWVALTAGRAVAVATVQISAQSAVLRDWFVEPDHRRRGIGRAVLGRALDLCRRAEIKNLLVVNDQPGVLTGIGFEPVGTWTEFSNRTD